MKIVLGWKGVIHMSTEAKDLLWNERNRFWSRDYEVSRDDPDLVFLVERLGKKVIDSRYFTRDVRIVEIPNDVDWVVETYYGCGDCCGSERIVEKHRVWE